MTLTEAKNFLRIDQDFDDERIQALMVSAKVYIAEATGLDENLQDSEPLCKVATEFLLRHWYCMEIDTYSERVLESLLKAIKAKYTTGITAASSDTASTDTATFAMFSGGKLIDSGIKLANDDAIAAVLEDAGF